MAQESQQKFILGIDGGGSTTNALITDLELNPLGFGEAGPCNPNTVGFKAAANEIDAAFNDALSDAKIEPSPEAVHFGIAGIANDSIELAMRVELLKFDWVPPHSIAVYHDLACALEGGLEGRPGIVLIAGTGSSAYGRSDSGKDARASGRDLGNEDPGSGYAIGLAALKAMPKNKDIQSLVTSVDDRAQVARLAMIVLSAAEEDEQWALNILEEQSTSLAQLTVRVSSELFKENNPSIVLQGGLTKNELYREMVISNIQSSIENSTIVEPLHEGTLGACMLARKLLEA